MGAWWIRKGRVLEVDGTHGQVFLERPDFFGFSSDIIEDICFRYHLKDLSDLEQNEDYLDEAHPAWDEMMYIALTKGAIRVRSFKGFKTETWVIYDPHRKEDLINAMLDFPDLFIGIIHVGTGDGYGGEYHYMGVENALKSLTESKKRLKESTKTLKQFRTLYHGSQYGELRSDENHKYNCLYVTPVFAYAALYSTGSNSEHGCVFEMKPIRPLNIFDANDKGALGQLKAKVEELNPDDTRVRRIDWEALKTQDWSTVCFRRDDVRDNLLLKAVKELGYDGYINHEWDADCAMYYARGMGGCGLVINSISIGIFDENLLEIVDEKYFDDYSDDALFNKCHQADEDLFIGFLQDEGFDDYYYDNEEDAKKWAAENLLFLDVDEVNDLFDEYGNCYDEEEE